MRIDDKDLHKFMKGAGYVYKKLSKHCIVFTNGEHDVYTSKTTSDKKRRLRNLKCELRRLQLA